MEVWSVLHLLPTSYRRGNHRDLSSNSSTRCLVSSSLPFSDANYSLIHAIHSEFEKNKEAATEDKKSNVGVTSFGSTSRSPSLSICARSCLILAACRYFPHHKATGHRTPHSLQQV